MKELLGLKGSIDKLEQAVTKNASVWWTFYRGIISGLGFFIGGTILAVLLVYLLTFFNTAPIIGEYI